MKKTSSFLAAVIGLPAGLACLILLAGCIADTSSRRGGHRSGGNRQVHATMVFEDDYDYYPGYEVYYSRNRREYVYRDRNEWVRRPAPGGISLDILLASPSVRVDFRDAPERHHASVIRSYPRNWRRPDNKQDDHRNDHQDKKDRRNDDKDDRNDNRR